MEFQCVAWNAEDVGDDEDEETQTARYTIEVFGRNDDGKSVCARFLFNPYFFVECPSNWGVHQIKMLESALSRSLGRLKDDLKDVTLVERKKFYGFTNGETFRFARVVFTSKKAFTRASYALAKPLYVPGVGRTSLQLYESNVDPLLRFCHVQNVQMAGWASVPEGKYKEPYDKRSNCDIEIEVASWKSVTGTNRQDIGPIVQASFDIETYSHDGSFPDAEDSGCPCIQIATTFQRFGETEPYKRHLLNLGTIDPIDGVDTVACKTEHQLLEQWAQLIRSEDPDVVIGYNIWGFDLHYMYTRARLCGAIGFFELGRYDGRASICKAASFSSGAYGDSDYMMVDTLGRLQIDLLVVMKREHKLSSYSLNAVSEHFLGDKKVDMPYKLMFEKYKGTSADRKEIGVYCVKDTDLPLALVNRLAILPNMVEMAKATWVPMSFLIERGQGIKVFSQIVRTTRLNNMLVVTLKRGSATEEQAYEGATVLGAKAGAYMDAPITGLDFASLYPTIMRAHNLCHSTLVIDDKKYGDVQGITYTEYDGYKFAQNCEGILPMMLRTLAENRKQAKRDMADAAKRGDAFMKSVYNGKQLAFKVTMNSIYGFCGANVGMLPCKAVAKTTTGIGRQMIEQTKNLVEKWYPGAEVVYGDTDSVMVKFDTGLRGYDALKKSFELGEEAAQKISATFKKPIELEFEKVYFPYLLFSKKRYAGLMYTNPEKSDYIDAKGIQIVRRDNCKYVRDISKEVLNTIMYKNDTKLAVKMAQDAAQRLLSNEVPLDDLVVSKSLRRIGYVKTKVDVPVDKKYIKCNGFYLTHEYGNANLPHITVAIKKEEREPGRGPKSGDRVPYVFIDTGNNKDLQYLKAEDPEYAKAKSMCPDCEYYFHHGLRSPIESLFSVFFNDPYKEVFEPIFKTHMVKVNEQIDLREYLGLPTAAW